MWLGIEKKIQMNAKEILAFLGLLYKILRNYSKPLWQTVDVLRSYPSFIYQISCIRVPILLFENIHIKDDLCYLAFLVLNIPKCYSNIKDQWVGGKLSPRVILAYTRSNGAIDNCLFESWRFSVGLLLPRSLYKTTETGIFWDQEKR